jgi:hypothetical protein
LFRLELTQGSKASHDTEAFSASNKINELGRWEFEHATNDTGDDRRGSREGKQREGRCNVVTQIELDLLLHGDHEEDQEDTKA